MDSCQRPFETSYWVVEGRFLAGPHPLGVFEPAPPNISARLMGCGIRHLVDLTEEDRIGNYLARLPSYDEKTADRIFTYRQFPVPDFHVPTEGDAIEILDYIDQKVDGDDGGVYLHCYAGIGRTGTIVGLYLARHGIASGRAALKKIHELRAGARGLRYFMKSPQDAVQVKMVVNWPEGQ